MIDIKKKIQAARDYASKGYRTIRRVSENCNMVVRDKNAAKHFLDGAEWAEEEFLKNYGILLAKSRRVIVTSYLKPLTRMDLEQNT